MKKCTYQFENNYSYCPPSYIDNESSYGFQAGDWRKENVGLRQIQQIGSNNYSREAKEVRDRFKNYFCSPKDHLNGK